MQVVDDTGQPWPHTRPPRRVVSLVPSLTELVCALGAAPTLVGVTRYCTDPPAVVAALPKLGGTKNPDCDAILALRPEVVLVNSEENRREDADRLSQAGVALFVSFPSTVRDAARSIERVGALLGTEPAANALAQAIDRELDELAGSVRERSRFFCPIWRKPWMSFNRDTFVHDLLWNAGGDNVCSGAGDRYPMIELSDIAAAQPEVILLPDEPYRFAPRDLRHLEPLQDTPAWRSQRIHFVSGQALSWYGPRTPEALRSFRRLLRSPLPDGRGLG